jgi:peptide/nickel transport system substrate-binding protein
MTYRIFLAAALLMTFLALSGCGQHSRFGSDPAINYPTDRTKQPIVLPGKYGGEMSGTFLSDPKTLNVIVADDADSAALSGMLFDSLESRDGFTLKFVPRLAYRPKISADGLTYTYTLRPGLKWSDGVPLTTGDIIFTLKLIFDPSIQTLMTESMLVDVNQPDGTVKRVPFKWVKVNDRTIKFILPVPWAPAEEMFGFPIVPRHCLEAIYKRGGFNSAWNVDTPPSQIVGSGPFLISKYVAGQRIILKRNPLFWRYSTGQHLPYLDRFDYLIMPDTPAAVLNFRGGASDVLSIPLPQYPTIAEYAKRDNYTVINRGPSWGFSYLSFNLNPNSKLDKRLLKIFSDVRFRQACSYAIDRDGICKQLFLGLANPLYTPETPADTVYFDSTAPKYPYDTEKARQLLHSMGMVDGPGGLLLYGGKPVTFNILTDTESQPSKMMATVAADDLRSVGLDAQFTAISFDDLVRRLDAPPYDWQAHLLGFTGGPEPNDGADLWRSSGHDHVWWPNQKSPATPWEAKIDRDFTNGAHELKPAKRKIYYDDWQNMIGVEQPMIFLVYSDQFSAVRNHFGNIEPSSQVGLSGDVYWNLEEIYNTKAARQTP